MTIKLDKTRMVRNLAKRFYLVTHLDRALEDFDEEWEFVYKPKVRDNAWHPSGHCIPSPSELYDVATAPPREEGPRGMGKVFQVGHFWHQLLQYVAERKLGFCGADDVERRAWRSWDEAIPGVHGAYHWVTGSADISPCVIPHEGSFLVDFKTMAPAQFNQQGVPDWAAAKYEAQVNVYMELFGHSRAIIVAIDKGSGEMKEFVYEHNPALVDWIFSKWAFVSECLDAEYRPTAEDDELFGGPPLSGPVSP